ncbi:MAG: substrate-binding domain-containing protein [Pirellulales bacterium]|nr:substrate-binding domain-containing protein [Pirellulales bacterium]
MLRTGELPVMLRAQTLGLMLLAGCLASAGCSSETGSNSGSASSTPAAGGRIVLLMNGDSPFWDAVRVGIQAAAKELGVNAALDNNDATPGGQINRLRQYNTQNDILGVAVSVTDAANAAIADELKKLQTRGVKVVTIDSDVDRSKYRDARFAFIGTDNLEGGRQLGITARNLRPDGGQFVTFVGRTGAQNAIERIGGFCEGAGDKFQELDKMGDENDRTRARENVRNAIRNHPGLTTLVGIWSYNAPAIVDVVRETQSRSKYNVVVFDAEPLAIQQMSAGDIDAMVVQNPYEMGYQGVRLLNALVKDDQETIKAMLPQHGQPDGDLYDTGLKVVVPDEGSPLKAELFGAKTQFLKLSEFRAWLDKYNLKGS